MKVALGQIVGSLGDVAANLDLMDKLAAEAAGRGADLLLLPELFLSGYNVGPAVRELAEPLDCLPQPETGDVKHHQRPHAIELCHVRARPD